MKINRFFNLSKFSTGTTILVAVPVDTAGGVVPSPFFHPKLAQTPREGACSLCEGAYSLCVAPSVSPAEDEPGGMCLLSSGQTSQVLAEQSKMEYGIFSPHLNYLKVR